MTKLAVSGMRDTIEVILNSKRATAIPAVVEMLKSNPYLKKEEAEQLRKGLAGAIAPDNPAELNPPAAKIESAIETSTARELSAADVDPSTHSPIAGNGDGASSVPSSPEEEEAVSIYFKDHADEIAAEKEKPFQAIGGVVELLGQDYFPVLDTVEIPAAETAAAAATSPAASAVATESTAAKSVPKPKPVVASKRENTLQKINRLDIKGRIQLALKGSKEERGILIRDGTKVVALAVLEAPKLSDGEVEKFASLKNVLESVLRQIPMKRRFMKNYIVVRNLVANPRTPLDVGLGLMKNLLAQDLKNIAANKEVSETIRKLAMKMFKQKIEEANKK